MRVAIDARKIADFGIGTYIRGLLRGLGGLDSGDTYLALAPEGVELPPGVEHVVVDAPHYSVREVLTVGRAAERAGADVLHAPHYVVPMTRLPLVVTIHDLIHLHQPFRNPLKPLYARVMLRRAVAKASAVLTITEAVRRDIERELGAGDVVVTMCGVDPPPPSAPDPAAGTYFLFVGNDKPHKNVSLLVEAFSIVRRSMPQVSLLLVGGEFERFRRCDGVSTPGFVSADRLAALYRGAAALVIPSLEEGFGLPAAEAMAHRAPVITSNAAALLEVTGDAALHVGADDAQELADAMLRIATDDHLREQLVARGIERTRELTWTRCAETTREVYLRVLQRRQRSR